MSAKTSIHQPPSPSNGQNWRYPDREAERPEDLRRIGVKESLLKPSFGEAVKRHLDNFDLETSLNEIAEGSGRALEFSRHYGSRAHQTQRSGPMPGSMPSMAECDEMMNYQRRVLDSMQSIKEVIIAQQHALAEQRNYNYNNKPSSEADDDGSSFNDKAEGSGGFAGAEAKKRRGVSQHHSNLMKSMLMFNRGLLLQDAVTAAVDPRHPNGGEVQMVHEPCATLADYVSTDQRREYMVLI
ncbi:MAG: hypothetical protein Q9186_002156 [Xanthomendoza sp. 1 TL-2023]